MPTVKYTTLNVALELGDDRVALQAGLIVAELKFRAKELQEFVHNERYAQEFVNTLDWEEQFAIVDLALRADKLDIDDIRMLGNDEPLVMVGKRLQAVQKFFNLVLLDRLKKFMRARKETKDYRDTVEQESKVMHLVNALRAHGYTVTKNPS